MGVLQINILLSILVLLQELRDFLIPLMQPQEVQIRLLSRHPPNLPLEVSIDTQRVRHMLHLHLHVPHMMQIGSMRPQGGEVNLLAPPLQARTL